jgi:hypothetical protein
MRNKTITLFFLSVFSSNLFAAHCAGNTDFIKIEGRVYGKEWDLSTHAKTDWVIIDNVSAEEFVSPPEATFPADAKLVVTITEGTDATCTYSWTPVSLFSAGNVVLQSNKQADFKHLNLSVFSHPRTVSTSSTYDPVVPGDENKVLSNSCETIASRPEACSWEWL